MLCFLQMAAEMQAKSLNFLSVQRFKLLAIKNLPIYPCKKYLLSTKGGRSSELPSFR